MSDLTVACPDMGTYVQKVGRLRDRFQSHELVRVDQDLHLVYIETFSVFLTRGECSHPAE